MYVRLFSIGGSLLGLVFHSRSHLPLLVLARLKVSGRLVVLVVLAVLTVLAVVLPVLSVVLALELAVV